MFTRVRFSATALILALIGVALIAPGWDLQAQSPPKLFEAPRPGAKPTEHPVRPHQARKARMRLDALDTPTFVLNLFDNADRLATRTKVERPAPGHMVWHGRTDDDGIVTFAVVDGVATGTVYLDGRSFEITPDADGEYTIAELNAAAFPTEDAPLEAFDRGEEGTADTTATVSSTSTTTVAADGLVEIDVMVLWTPAARAAAGSTSAIQSLVLSAVANANLAYSNSLIGARLRLVHSSEVAFTEATSSIASDLYALRTSGDGKLDAAQTLRDQYGADIVTLLGNGYAAKGACGVAYMMSTPSTSFAGAAFNVVDRTCAAGYLSYAHEVGHNQGLNHDPGSSSGTPSYSYAYGYQEPSGLFRTVLSYGAATRIPYFSNPTVFYSGRATGTAAQDNARALRNTATVVSAFRPTVGTPTCSYTVTPTSLSFAASGGTATVSVSTTTGCSWTSSGSTFASVSGATTGSGTATVAVPANSGASRSATVVVAGKSVTVSQAAPTCTYTVSPAALGFTSSASSQSVTVTTASHCTWTSSSGTAWAAVSGTKTGSGTATVTVTPNGGASRSATIVVAGKSVTVSQAAATTACTYTVSPTALSFTSGASSKTVTVTTSGTCAWTSSSGTAWAAVSGTKSGSGTATVAVAANGGISRSATVVVAGKSVSVSQAANLRQ